jgi:multidrug efflux pump subunit AcrB
MKTQILQIIKRDGLLKGSLTLLLALLILPFTVISGLLSSVLMPLLVFILASVMFVYLVLNALIPNMINTLLNHVELIFKRLREIPSFAGHFSLKKDSPS